MIIKQKIICKIKKLFSIVKSIFVFFLRSNYLYKGFYWYAYIRIKTKILKRLGFVRLEKIFIGSDFKCNANCPHCYEKFKNNNLGAFLTTNECKNIIDQFKSLGGYQAFFCNGEFLLRPDSLELIRYCTSKKILTSVTTNGLVLNKTKINELKTAGLKFLVVSIDSADALKHDSLRGVSGCFKKATEGLRLAKEKGIRTQIWTYMTKSHSDELEGIAELGRKLKVDFVFVFFTLLSGNLFNKFEENFSFKEKEEIRKKFNFKIPILLEFSSENWTCRGGGREHINIAPTGDATFCPPVAYSYGNIRKESLRDLLIKIQKDYKRLSHCTRGECPINFLEYRKKCHAKFMYPD